jgi:hypothetical protein
MVFILFPSLTAPHSKVMGLKEDMVLMGGVYVYVCVFPELTPKARMLKAEHANPG